MMTLSTVFQVGDRVHQVGDPQHVGRVERVEHAEGRAQVRWHKGYATVLPFEELVRVQ